MLEKSGMDIVKKIQCPSLEFSNITPQEFLDKCLEKYNSLNTTGLEEFAEDLRLLTTIKRAIIKLYSFRLDGVEIFSTSILNATNNIRMLINVFGQEFSEMMLKYTISEAHWDILDGAISIASRKPDVNETIVWMCEALRNEG